MSPTPSPSSPLNGDLPLCRYRQPAEQPAAVRCESPILRLSGAIHPDICRGCAYPDVDAVPSSGNGRAACFYRGNLARHAPRAHGPDCGKAVAVFACAVHGQCTESRVADGVMCCAVCPQFRSHDTTTMTEIVEHDDTTTEVSRVDNAYPVRWADAPLWSHRIMQLRNLFRAGVLPGGLFHSKRAGKELVKSLGIAVAEEIPMPQRYVFKPDSGYGGRSVLLADSKHICEELIVDENGAVPPRTFRFYVFDGKVKMAQATSMAGGIQGKHTQGYYTFPDWQPLREMGTAEWFETAPPSCLTEMGRQAVLAASKIDFPCRVDFYASDKGIVFGEFCFTPGLADHITPQGDALLTKWWNDSKVHLPPLPFGVLTGANKDFWPTLQALVLACWEAGVPLAVFDHGLTPDQVDLLTQQEVQVIPHRVSLQWIEPALRHQQNKGIVSAPQTWIKPKMCLASPFELTLWIDADAVPIRGLREMFFEQDFPFVTKAQGWGGIHLYHDLLAALGKKENPIYSYLNSGVFGFRRGDQWLDDWDKLCIRFLSNPELLSKCPVRDQSGMLATLILSDNPPRISEEEGINYPANGLGSKQTADRRKYPIHNTTEFLRQLRQDHAPHVKIVHWLGRNKPWQL